MLEIGSGHGFGLLAIDNLVEKPKKVMSVEISDRFREEYLKPNVIPKLSYPVELYADDCKDMSSFLPSHTSQKVDVIFAMNVVYFLHPLDAYLEEFYRVLREPNTQFHAGRVVFGCKFNMLPAKTPPFYNVNPDDIVQKMKDANFSDVSVEYVHVVEETMYNYVEISGVKK